MACLTYKGSSGCLCHQTRIQRNSQYHNAFSSKSHSENHPLLTHFPFSIALVTKLFHCQSNPKRCVRAISHYQTLSLQIPPKASNRVFRNKMYPRFCLFVHLLFKKHQEQNAQNLLGHYDQIYKFYRYNYLLSLRGLNSSYDFSSLSSGLHQTITALLLGFFQLN